FLYDLGSGDSMIRVRDLDLRPGATGTNLSASITLVASYQRATTIKPAAAPSARTNATPTVPANTTIRGPTNVASKVATNKASAAVKISERVPALAPGKAAATNLASQS